MTYDLTLLGLGLLACLSPLLTFARLWQLKEWRWDRLREHIKEEGFEATFVSRLRIVVAGACILFPLLTLALTSISTNTLVMIASLPAALAVLTVLQIVSGRQPLPVWTTKAKMLVALCLVIDLLTLLLTLIAVDAVNDFDIPYVAHPYRWTLWVLPYCQPLVAAIAWTLLLPIDRFLKSRILNKATALRAKHPDLRVIGITGSVGKTTTKELITHVLKKKGHGTSDMGQHDVQVFVTPEHVNTEMGVAQWLTKLLGTGDWGLEGTSKSQMTSPKSLIVEMGAYRKGEIKTLCRIAQPQWGVLTHIGTQHIGLFGSPENLQDAKAELIEALPADGHAFLNGDNAGCREVAKRAPCPVTLVGTGGHLDLEAFDIEETTKGIRFRCDDVWFDIPLHGTHNVTNVLLAIAVGKKAGMTTQVIAHALATFTPPSKTFTVRTERGVTILDDTHNASESSITAAIAWAAEQKADRKILVTPGLIEMGKLSAAAHEHLGTLARASFDDVVFLNTKNAQHFSQGYGKNVTILSQKTPHVTAGTLLVCVGRMPASTIERLLPTNE